MKTNIFLQTKIQLRRNINWHVSCLIKRKIWMGPLIDEIKLQVDEKNNKNWKK